MQLQKLFLLLALTVFSCFGQEIFDYVGTCWKFVNHPDIQFPIYLKPPFDALLTKLQLKRTTTVGTKPRISLLGQTVQVIEKVPPPCYGKPLATFIPKSTPTDKTPRTFNLAILWTNTLTELESVIAHVPANFGDVVTEMYGINSLAMIPVYFVTNDIKMGNSRRLTISPQPADSRDVQKTVVSVKYDLILQHPNGFSITHTFWANSELSDNPRNSYYLHVQTFDDKKFTKMIREQTFICDVKETKVKSVQVSSSRVPFFVDPMTIVVSFKILDANGNLVDHLYYVKENGNFKLRTDEAKHKWDIFKITSRGLNPDFLARYGPFCLHPFDKTTNKRCIFGQKELTLTEYQNKQITLDRRSSVVPTVESAHVIRPWRPAYRDEIKECKDKIN